MKFEGVGLINSPRVRSSSMGSRMRSIEWWYFQSPWWTSNTVFKVTAFLKSNISNVVRS